MPVAEDDFARVFDFVEAHRAVWERSSVEGLLELARHLSAAGYEVREAEEGREPAAGRNSLEADTVILSGRLKDSHAIVAKMRRFGEPLRAMLDIWGFRAIVATEHDLDNVAACCVELWDIPAPAELLLRHGDLQFDWWRDYRLRDHAGLSPATTARYDQAIHINRKASWGIVEIQAMTFDLYRRVHCDPSGEDSHARFVARRENLFRGGEQ